MAKKQFYDELLTFLADPFFQIPVRTFMDENCLIFDANMEPVEEHKIIHLHYKKLVDSLLESFCKDIKISIDDVISGISKLSKIIDLREVFQIIFEQVLAANDFEMFWRVMARRNIIIQEQVIMMIIAATGQIPFMMHKSNNAPSSKMAVVEDKQEEELLQQVMQESQQHQGRKRQKQLVDDEEINHVLEMSKQEAEILKFNRLQLEEDMKRLTFGEEVDNRKRSTSGSPQGAVGKTPSKKTEDTPSSFSGMELRKRQEFFREQREKLLAMKKLAREKQLGAAEKKQGAQRPLSSKAARKALNEPESIQEKTTKSAEDDKKMAMRRAIAEKLREEVIEKY